MPGTTNELALEVVSAPRLGGRYFGKGDSAPVIGSLGPFPFNEVAFPNPFPTGSKVTRLYAKARGSDAGWSGLVRMTTKKTLNDPVVRRFPACEMSGPSGQDYDTCVSTGEYVLSEGELLTLWARSDVGPDDIQSSLTRVSGCLIIEPAVAE